MGSGNEPAGQQAMTSERLAEIEHQQHQMAHDGHAKLSNELFLTVAVSDLLAEVERLRAREAALVTFAWQVASNHEHKWRGERCKYCDVEFSGWAAETQKQARALLASADEQKGSGDGQRVVGLRASAATVGCE